MEVLLTLAIMVIISGVAWIALQRPLARQRLRSAADAVHTEWCQARVDAMKSGHTYAFRYMVHGDRYHLGPQDDPSAVDSSPGRTSLRRRTKKNWAMTRCRRRSTRRCRRGFVSWRPMAAATWPP